MNNYRLYGKPPYTIVVVHGGPGAPGEMKPVAEELSRNFGVIEPLQTENSIAGQNEELKKVIETNTTLPVTLIGHSWGAMLSFIFTARNNELVKKLILISSSVFEEKYATNIMQTRYDRLSSEERQKLNSLLKRLNNPTEKDKNVIFTELGKYSFKTDSYRPMPHESSDFTFQYYIYKKVWKEAEIFRKNGEFLKLGKLIHCPVVAIHGDYDPHPPEGIKTPLNNVLDNFKFVLLKNCGHYPWLEKEAKDIFYKIVNKELQ